MYSGGPFFARVSDGQQAFAPSAVEYGSELRRRVALFRRVQSYGRDEVYVGEGLFQRAHRIVRAQVPQETQDESVGDAELFLSLAQRTGDALEHGAKGDPPFRVSLRIEEDLNMDHALLVSLSQVRGGQGVKVVHVAQYAGAGVVDVQE